MRSEEWSEHYRVLRSAAKLLRDAADYRGTTNRIYYALYALITAKSRRQPPYNRHDWQNPEHSQLPGMVSQIPGLSAEGREDIRQAVRTLYKERVRGLLALG